MILDFINSPSDLKKVDKNDLPLLANEIRTALIKRASAYGGHLGSNLGVVELTIALHYVFNSPVDKIVFDVSHQSYVHKMLTGRKDAYIDQNKYTIVTGFTNPLESEHDQFNIGHTSTSISLACGLALGRDLAEGTENVIAIIGDSALDGGEAFEALNTAGELNTGLIIVVNDNNMSIPENHGALNKHLNMLHEDNGSIDNNFFKSLGFDYILVKDGHDIYSLIKTFEKVKDTPRPVVVHCCTQKGKGYIYAEQDREKWHHAHPFNIETGEFNRKNSVPKENYGAIVGAYLMDKIKNDKKVIAMTASVPACFGFNLGRRKEAGSQFVDVGIAEQNMISMAAGLAKTGCKPVTITESSFYQRAYDQIQQEMCINKCAVTMLIAFSGIYAHNDDTHIGFYDIVLLGNIPGLIYLAPSNKQEYLAMLEWAIEQNESPVAIRIPWNGVYYTDRNVPNDYSTTKYEIQKVGEKVAIIGLGSFFQLGEEVARLLEKEGIKATIVNPQFASGIDKDILNSLKSNHELVVTLEDGIVSGGFGARIAQYYGPSGMKTLCCGFGMDVPTKFSVEEMLEKNGLKPQQIVNRILQIID